VVHSSTHLAPYYLGAQGEEQHNNMDTLIPISFTEGLRKTKSVVSIEDIESGSPVSSTLKGRSSAASISQQQQHWGGLSLLTSSALMTETTYEEDEEDEFGEGKQREYSSSSSSSIDRRLLLMCSYMVVMSTLFGSLVGFVGPIFMCFVWAIAALFCHLFLTYHPTENLAARLLARAALIGLMLTGVLLFHLGTHKTIHLMERELWDSTLLQLDRTILGGFFPEGQLALWADNSGWIGPDSFLGRVITEVLQLLYFSYYIWGNALVIYMGFEYLWAVYRNGWRHDKLRWRRIQMLLLCFVGTYLLNFSVNFIFPAVSPRIYLADRYQNELRGFWIGDLMRDTIKKGAANSYGAFPSGHVALTWIPALAASKLGYRVYGRICEVAAAGITLATIFLRYHYFMDAMFATLLVIFGLYFGRIIGCQPFDRSIDKKQADTV